jgi:hypothetical protein
MEVIDENNHCLDKKNEEKINSRTQNAEEFHQKVNELKFLRVPIERDDVPAVYREVLMLLRQADRSKAWPASSSGRQMVIERNTLLESGGRGGSFSVGAFPPPLPQPKGNTVFAGETSLLLCCLFYDSHPSPLVHIDLMMACFKLERVLCPNRPPSSTIAINRHAQFLPHRDTGAGSGQKRSLIVALGMFTGGEIVVDNEMHDIRYNPIEFDGWQSLHYNLPFYGERYSLVWFTPLGITDEDLWWWRIEEEGK